MRRFQSPLLKLLRLREQKEQMRQLEVARARTAVNVAADRLAEAQRRSDEKATALEAALQSRGSSLLMQQALLEWESGERAVHRCLLELASAEQSMHESVTAYGVARQEREMVDRIVERRREEHRREGLRAAAVELQEWTLRPAYSSVTEQREGVERA